MFSKESYLKPLARRQFLQLLGKTAALVALAPLTSLLPSIDSPEVSPAIPRAQATVVNPEGGIDVLFTATNTKGKIFPSQVGIFGVDTKSYCYIITPPQDQNPQKVPMWQLQVKKGNPFDEDKLVSFTGLGIRCNEAKIMALVPKIGAAKVRIAANGPEGLSNPSVLKALEVAKQDDLEVLLCWNPTRLLGEREIKQKIRRMYALYPNINWEWGNEPDLLGEIEFWKDRDLDTFAQFVKIATAEVRRLEARSRGLKPHSNMVVGALADIEHNTSPLLDCLKKAEVDFQEVQFGLHVYHEPDAVKERLNFVRQFLEGSDIVITELGVDDGNTMNKSKLITMLDEAIRQGVKEVYIHELPSNERDWGIVRPDGLINPIGYQIQAWVQNQDPSLWLPLRFKVKAAPTPNDSWLYFQ